MHVQDPDSFALTKLRRTVSFPMACPLLECCQELIKTTTDALQVQMDQLAAAR